MKHARTILFLMIFISLSALAALLAIASLRWRMAHDTPVVLYMGYLIDHFGLIPYRDFWDINLPGTYFIYALIGRLTAESDLPLRIFDLAYLATLLGLTGAWLRPLGWKVAWAAAALFGLSYLGGGVGIILQREYLGLLPLVGAIVIATSLPRLNDVLRATLIGLLVGLIATMKPQLSLALPFVLFYGYLEWRDRQPMWSRGFRGWARLLAVAIAGFALPLIAVGLYMTLTGALPYYLDILRHYYPLYSHVTTNLTIIADPASRFDYMVSTFLKFGGHLGWIIPAGIGLTGIAASSGVLNTRQCRRVTLAAALAAIFSIYPVFSGQFFSYHWLPFLFFILILAALCFAEPAPTAGRFLRWLPVGALVLGIALRWGLLTDVARQVSDFVVSGRVPADDNADRAEDMASKLAARLQPGDTVQPLDWVDGGVLHALLRARAKIATPYLADMVFYHDVSNPYIQGLRRDLLLRLDASPPRFVLDFQYVTWIRGPDTVEDFPELRLWLADNYTTVDRGNTYELDERVSRLDPAMRRGLVVYTTHPFALTQWDALFPNRPVTSISASQPLDSTAAGSLLEKAVAGNDALTLLFALSAQADPGHRLERWAAHNLYRLSERQGVDARVVDYLVGGPECASTTLRDLRFGDAIAVKAAGVGLTHTGRDQVVCVRLQWAAEQPIRQPYTVAVHITDSSGQIVAQYDSQPQGGLMPATTWLPGQTVIDLLAIRLPESLLAGKYVVYLLVYDPASGARLPASGSGSAGDQAVIAEIAR